MKEEELTSIAIKSIIDKIEEKDKWTIIKRISAKMEQEAIKHILELR